MQLVQVQLVHQLSILTSRGQKRKQWAKVEGYGSIGPLHERQNMECFLQQAIFTRDITTKKKLEYKAKTGRLRGRLLDSGFYEDQTYGALKKAWLAYIISCKHDDWERRSYYAAVIQKLEGELGLKKYDFPEIKDLAADFLDDHQDEPTLQDMSVEEIEELMRKSDSAFWQTIREGVRN